MKNGEIRIRINPNESPSGKAIIIKLSGKLRSDLPVMKAIIGCRPYYADVVERAVERKVLK